MSTDELAIDVRGLTKRFGDKTVVDHFDIAVPRGAIYGFLGPNGSGKTTTIRMICGLLEADEGAGTCLGFDVITESARIKEQVGYMTQRFSLYEDLSIRENLEFVARMYGLKNPRGHADAALEGLGLTARAKQLAGRLSGGWKQRLALAASLIHDPQLLLLDEPTAGVDPKARRDFWDSIRNLSSKGVTVLVSTHYMDEAIQCDFITFLAYGRKLVDGPAREVPARSGLNTWIVSGRQIGAAADRLQNGGEVQIIRFGDVLHMSSTDEAAIRAAAARLGDLEVEVTPAKAGLEDVFIHLMTQSADNYQ